LSLSWGGLVAFGLLRIVEPGAMAAFQNGWFDLEQRLLPRDADLAPITIVEIDEASIEALGQWPWPRDLIASLISAIAEDHPRAVGLDIIFSEPDRMSPENLARRLSLDSAALHALAGLPSNDDLLAESLKQVPAVLAVAVKNRAPSSGLDGSELRSTANPGTALSPNAILRNLAILEDASAGSGLVSLALEPDGIARRMPAAAVVGDAVLPSLAVEMLRVAAGREPMVVASDRLGITRVMVGGHRVDTDRRGRIWLRYAPIDSFLRLPAADVLARRYDSVSVRDRFVLIGTTAAGLRSEFMTPLGRAVPALDLQAQTLENLLTESYLRRPWYLAAVEMMLAIALCIGTLALRPKLIGYPFHVAIAGSGLLLISAGFLAFSRFGLLFDPTFPLVAALVVYLGLIVIEFLDAHRQRRRTEKERETALLLAEAANRSKTEFLANMSHELRTPLNAIIGFSEMMESELLGRISPPKYKEYAQDIHLMGRHLLGIVDQVLDMAKIESGKVELHEQRIDVAAATEDCVRVVRTAYRLRGAEIALELPEQWPQLDADLRMLRQMIVNLLSNAIKFTPADGKIRISGQVGGRGEFRLCISDTGVGMGRRELVEALKPFRSGSHSIASETEGIGLGLPLTKAMIELHGGRLELESTRKRGTAATLVFPAARVVAASDRARHPEGASSDASLSLGETS
jgi:adenylate cyclase